jgi:putative oxidoreductase
MIKLYDAFCNFCATVVAPLANLAARIYLGWSIFFVSGLAKLDDFEETVELFDDDFAVPFLPAEPAAYLATAGELVLPILLIAGLFTRIGALGLLVMTAVIQIFVLQDPQHYLWMLVLGLLVGYGGGKLSLDNIVLGRAK